MALASYTAATPGTQPDFRCGFDIELAHAILQRMADGESLAAICRTAGMPTAATVYRWAARYEDFGEAFVLIRNLARQNQAGRTARARATAAKARKGVKNPKITGRASGFSVQVAEAICKRLMRGEGLQEICRDPAMVSVGTVYNWLHRYPQFARDYGRARQMQAFVMQDRSVDLVLSTGPGGHRQADKVLARMRQRMAVLSAKAWDLEARPGAPAAPLPAGERSGEGP
ncbi:MAG: helix-turn-helix domain-containing protein [Parvibaculum sp.]|uniref:terminase small subunit-like protein n=1 Tax=Parvibaculum sp. TaxID=2024848 RepID=UPI002AB87429|nr:helix-turn-helix domain-containing protein [Parvibaculum sp.]MDZ4379703.1 helix-turn-helix domain-containing protein [Parvibaculum sp.]